MGRGTLRGPGTATVGFTVEQAAEIVRDLPEGMSHESAARIVTSTLRAADIEVEQLLRSCEEQEAELKADIDRGQQTVADVEQSTEETIRSLERQIAEVREACDIRLREEQENIEQAQSSLANLRHVRGFLAPLEQQEPQEDHGLPPSAEGEAKPPKHPPVGNGEIVKVEDVQGESATKNSPFNAVVRALRFRHGLHTAILLSTLLSAGAISYITYIIVDTPASFSSSQPQTDTGSVSSESSGSVSPAPLTDEAVELMFKKSPSPSLATPSGAMDYDGQIALTFDDGPDPEVTPTILDTLQAHDLKATFFVNGEKAAQHPELIRHIVREGHTLGNHTYDHPNMASLSPEQMRVELQSTQETVDQALGYHYDMSMMRPPYGEPYYANQGVLSRFQKVMRGQRLSPVLWSIDSRDWALTSQPRSIVRTALQNTGESGGVLLLHDTHQSTAKALSPLITRYKEKGIEFAGVAELLANKYGVELERQAQEPRQ